VANERRRRDPYEVLGVARNADAETIRKAYRRLARQHHPDVNPGDHEAESRFKEVSEAWAILSDPDKRRNYDEFGDVALEAGFDAAAARRAREAFGARFGAGQEAGGAAAGAFHFDLDDLLNRAFPAGARRGRRGPRRGADLETTLELDFLDAVRGGERRLDLVRPGEGGPQRESVSVRIPAGVADGGRIRVPGRGAPGTGGGPAGDLWATIRVRPHPVFRREGRDLFIEVPISVGEAIEGAKVEIPTLEGRAVLTIPPGTDSGRRLRLRGKGVPDPSGGERGDLYALVQIRVPRDLDEAARSALKDLERFDPPDLRKDLFR
jgi:DnaJ-class molecular chaperone